MREEEKLICYCFSVTEQEIRDTIQKQDLDSVADVTWFCGAGGGCGGCRYAIFEILNSLSHNKKPVPNLKPNKFKF